MGTEKYVLVKRIFTNGLNMGWPLQKEQRSFFKYLLAEKCKLCEIYRRIFNGYRETCFSQKNLYEWAKHGLATTNRTEVFHQIFVG